MTRAERLQSLRQRAEQALRELPEQSHFIDGEVASLDRLLEDLRVYRVELEMQNEELQVAQQRAELASARHQQLFQYMPLPALVLDKAGHIQDNNNLSRDWLGERSGFVPTDARLMRALNQASRAALWHALNATDTTAEQVLSGLVLKTTDNPERPIDIHLLRLPDSYHIDHRVLALLVDRSTDMAMSTQKQLFQTLIDSSDDLIFSTDRHGRFTLANQALLDALEKDMPSLLRQPRDAVMSVRDAIAHEISDQAILGNRQTMSMEENMFIPRLGEMRFFTTHKFPLLNADGVITGIGGISRDITAARQNTQMQRLSEAVFHERHRGRHRHRCRHPHPAGESGV
jgi:PAS domain S-box-containing protein